MVIELWFQKPGLTHAVHVLQVPSSQAAMPVALFSGGRRAAAAAAGRVQSGRGDDILITENSDDSDEDRRSNRHHVSPQKNKSVSGRVFSLLETFRN